MPYDERCVRRANVVRDSEATMLEDGEGVIRFPREKARQWSTFFL